MATIQNWSVDGHCPSEAEKKMQQKLHRWLNFVKNLIIIPWFASDNYNFCALNGGNMVVVLKK